MKISGAISAFLCEYARIILLGMFYKNAPPRYR